MTILTKILETKKQELAGLRTDFPETDYPAKPRLADLLRLAKPAGVIAEIKRSSPSKGVIRAEVDVIGQAKRYEQAGASAISVLTDESYFNGSIDDLHEVAKQVAVPVLNKDFIVDKKQIDRAKNAGATVVLLIVAALDDEKLHELFAYTEERGLEALVEVHDEEEMKRALALGAELIGINNRNLSTFEVSLENTEKLASFFTDEQLFISESGIHSPADAQRAVKTGVKGLLIGESLMRANDPGAFLDSLFRQEEAR
ncbi:indole-3-glycerol phosphate synthase TrpC [Planococcus lenghuensis]|uniref:Indole-3-glycerol phosphate synthase n=1 Tax=Planococcus lenghuensis TaxID=2213202 RepID=A0A1Q2L0L7_9BACL|nr:indole-3-glycerol phosphate synthase TrpC [Planococcus lenghuensis]AQQ53988.1 indole-3-glycerol phosphate synthase [Planococcus lenghuensis]